jgi:hypothetical protein
MKNKMIAMMFAALLSLAAVACEGGTATDDGTGVGEPGTTQDDGMMDDPTMDDGTGGMSGDGTMDDGTGDL